MSEIAFKIEDEEVAASVAMGGQSLRDLCHKEVDLFDKYLRQFGSQYADGLARFERLAIEGYLYQKIRGHLDSDEKIPTGDLPVWREDGQARGSRG
jgi:hypothetical protein